MGHGTGDLLPLLEDVTIDDLNLDEDEFDIPTFLRQ